MCLDGSPAGYYFREGDPKKWIFALSGGGWCWDAESCVERAATPLGSSLHWPAWDVQDGLLLANATLNPDFAGYTSAFTAYCDGASFSGYVADPVVVHNGSTGANTTLFFRGHAILDAAIDALLARGMGAADEVIVNGGSAGGLATQLHVDYIAGRVRAVNPGARVSAIIDCGFFIDAVDVFGHAWAAEQYQSVVALQNISSGPQVDEDCVAASAGGDVWQCFMAQFTYPFISTPIFIVQSALDAWQLPNLLAPLGDGADASYAKCFADPPAACNGTQFAQFLGYGVQLMAALNMSRAFSPHAYTQNGGVVTSCVRHGQLQANSMDAIVVDGKSIITAVGDWYFQRTPRGEAAWYIDGPFGSNPTCPPPLGAAGAPPLAARGGTFNVLDYGAVGDGKTYDTAAIRATFAACGAAGGGTVLFPSGYTFLSGAFNMSGDTVVRVDGRIQGGLDARDYALMDPLPWYGPDASANPADPRDWGAFMQSWYVNNVTITGAGTIDMGGTADGWWSCASNTSAPPCNGHPRPHGIRLVGATGVEISGVTIANSPMWTVHIAYCTGVWVHGVTILAPKTSHNTDGIDFDCSQEVLLEDSFISNGDDCICMKSGKDWAGRTYGRPTANVTVRNMVLGTGHGITVGSETSGGVYNVTFENIVANGTGTGVRLKSERGRGGVVRDIVYRNISLYNIGGQAVQMTLNYATGLPPGNASSTPVMRNVWLQDIYAERPIEGYFIDGLPESPITNATFTNVTILNPSKVLVQQCDNITASTCHAVFPSCPPCMQDAGAV